MYHDKHQAHRTKVKSIYKALHLDPPDVATLRKLSISPHGLITSELRSKVWPHLLDVAGRTANFPEDVKDHPEYRQVLLDVDRSGKHFPLGLSEEGKTLLKDDLTEVILAALCHHKNLHYYQGYHEICITVLLVCGKHECLPLLEKLSTYHLRDFMDPTMDSTSHILNYLIPILQKANPGLVRYLVASQVGTLFSIAWLITWFSYVIDNASELERLFDFFLACHPLMPVYFASQLVLEHAAEIMDGECDMARVFQVVAGIARQPNLPLESLISKASDFYIQYPPSSLAHDAIDYYKNNLAMSTFSDYALVAKHELPDTVLQRLGLVKEVNKAHSKPKNAAVSRWELPKKFAMAVGAALVVASSVVVEWGFS